MGTTERKDLLFLKKKKQKDFYPRGCGVCSAAIESKVFCFFSSEKKNLPLSTP